MTHKAVAVHHDDQLGEKVAEYDTEEQAILAAVQFSHGAGVKHAHVVDDKGKKVWSSDQAEGETKEDKPPPQPMSQPQSPPQPRPASR